MFWIYAALLIILTLWVLLPPLLKKAVIEEDDRRDQNIHIAKEQLAMELVERFYDEESAKGAKSEFDNVFKSNQIPSDINEVDLEEGIWICKALVDAGLEPSTSQARRDIKQGGVKLDQEKVTGEKLNLDSGEYILQVGKRKFAKIKVG